MCCFSSCVMVYFPGPELDQHEDRKLREIFNALFDVYWKQYVKKKTFINSNQPSAAERAVSARGWFVSGCLSTRCGRAVIKLHHWSIKLPRLKPVLL